MIPAEANDTIQGCDYKYLEWLRFAFITKPFTSWDIIFFQRRVTVKKIFQQINKPHCI
jgi:hypothetical protein